MSDAAWIGLASILVMVALAITTAVFGFIAYMLRSNWESAIHRVHRLESKDIDKEKRLIWMEAHLERKGIMPPMPVKDPSPTLKIEDGAG